MQRLKVMTILGTRPEIIRLACVLGKLDAYTEHTLVHTGQNYDYELSGVFFDELGLRRPDRVGSLPDGSPTAKVAAILQAADAALAEVQPDALLILGDTNSSLSAYAAKRRKIPVFHMEAGNRCRDERVPEEINRRMIDHISDVNMPYSEAARQNLVHEGLPPERVIKTGSPLCEVLAAQRPRLDASAVMSRLGLAPRDFYVVSVHREETVDDPQRLKTLVQALNGVAATSGKRLIMSCHPRTRQRLAQLGEPLHKGLVPMKPLGFADYLRLQTEAIAVLSDSGTITEESSLLNFPALNLRESHERAEGMDEGSVMFTGLSGERILQGLAILRDQPRGDARLLKVPADYDVANVSDKVVRIIHSYVDVVRRQTGGR